MALNFGGEHLLLIALILSNRDSQALQDNEPAGLLAISFENRLQMARTISAYLDRVPHNTHHDIIRNAGGG